MLRRERIREWKNRLLPIHKRLKITTLSHWDWADKDTLILHSAFQCLVDFIDDECSPGVVDWDYDDEHREAMREMRRLYDWWKARPDRTLPPYDPFPLSDFEKPREERSEEYRRAEPIMDYHNALESQWEKEDEENLLALMKIRKYLWT